MNELKLTNQQLLEAVSDYIRNKVMREGFMDGASISCVRSSDESRSTFTADRLWVVEFSREPKPAV